MFALLPLLERTPEATCTLVLQGRAGSVKCQAGQDAKLGHKRVLLLAHGKKAEKPEFKEAYAWLEKAGHDIDMVKTGSPEDMSEGVKKMITHFNGMSCSVGHVPTPTKHIARCLYTQPGILHAHESPPCFEHFLHVYCHSLPQPVPAHALNHCYVL